MPMILSAIRDLPPQTDDTAIWQAVRQGVTEELGKTMDSFGGEFRPNWKKPERTGRALNEKLSAPNSYLAQLLRGLRRLVHDNDDRGAHPNAMASARAFGSRIPQGETTVDREDPVLTLSFRINTAGVKPNGEELTYSILNLSCRSAERVLKSSAESLCH